MSYAPTPVMTRLAAKCERTVDGCFVWRGTVHKREKYGMILIGRKSDRYVQGAVHVIAYKHHFGDVPKNHYVRQTCGNKLCVEPSHLLVVSASDLAKQDDFKRFEKYAERMPSGCIEWSGGRCPQNYGLTNNLAGENRAHRAAYRLFKGEIPPGIDVLHRCDNPPCVNPDHLFLGDDQINSDDKWAKGRGNPPKGERNTKAKLSADDVMRIRRLFSDGNATKASLAKEYGVKPPAIYKIITGRTWRHILPGEE